VRVAHFSFITHVERQLCIVNRGYAIVTKQQLEEIERKTSFLQHYKRKVVKRRYSHLQQSKSWLMTATRKRPEVNETGNPQEMRDPMDHIREVPTGATEMIRTVCKETLQSLVTTFTNMELEIKVIGSLEQQRR
jgi:hypothetical protein